RSARSRSKSKETSPPRPASDADPRVLLGAAALAIAKAPDPSLIRRCGTVSLSAQTMSRRCQLARDLVDRPIR
ncbi:MAG: hypothetical protein M3499_03235, partial [Actinomycetota bacterium]|nr:hypothetical protein [Actinomycetota bacterium]